MWRRTPTSTTNDSCIDKCWQQFLLSSTFVFNKHLKPLFFSKAKRKLNITKCSHSHFFLLYFGLRAIYIGIVLTIRMEFFFNFVRKKIRRRTRKKSIEEERMNPLSVEKIESLTLLRGIYHFFLMDRKNCWKSEKQYVWVGTRLRTLVDPFILLVLKITFREFFHQTKVFAYFFLYKLKYFVILIFCRSDSFNLYIT